MLTAVYDLERYCKASERCEMSSRFHRDFLRRFYSLSTRLTSMAARSAEQNLKGWLCNTGDANRRRRLAGVIFVNFLFFFFTHKGVFYFCVIQKKCAIGRFDDDMRQKPCLGKWNEKELHFVLLIKQEYCAIFFFRSHDASAIVRRELLLFYNFFLVGGRGCNNLLDRRHVANWCDIVVRSCL